MSVRDVLRTCLLVCSVGILLHPLHAIAQANESAANGHDGQHDFDLDIGTWRTKLRRLMKPLTGSTTWVEYEGTTVVRKVWDGRANLAELQARGASGDIEALSLRLYNPAAREWSADNRRSGAAPASAASAARSARSAAAPPGASSPALKPRSRRMPPPTSRA